MSKELILKLRYIALCTDRADVREAAGQAADALEAKAAPVGEREAFEVAYAEIRGCLTADVVRQLRRGDDYAETKNERLNIAWRAYQAGAAYQRAQQPQATDWKASGADWCSSIHRNPDAKAWADFFVATFPGLADKHDLMLGWFANAMMAMHDHLKAQQPQSAEPVEWRCRVSGSDHYAHFPTKRCRFCEPLYTTPQPSAGVATDAARDVLAERQRQISAEGWTPEHDDEHDMGSLASAAGCYAMYTLAYPAGDPHPNWPWDKAWWKPSQDGRRNLVKAGALILAEIERLDRLNGKEVV